MGKFSFGKKGDEDDSSTRSALFGSRSKSKSPNPQTNPYANLPTQSDPYAQAKARAYDNSNNNNRGPSPAPPPGGVNGSAGRGYSSDDKKAGGYGGGPPRNNSGYGADKYGAQSGYGGDRYGSGNGNQQSSAAGGSKYGPGGYGGLGAVPDDNRDALFDGAKDRAQKQPQQQQQPQAGYGQPPPYGADYGQGGTGGPDGGYDGGGSQPSYEPYGDRQLTAEEEEEEDVQATKQQMRFLKQEDVSSTRTALRIAAQAEESGMNTLARLGAQGERIHNTEKNLDLTANHNRIAEEKAKELKQLNRSMFAVHVSNPFTATSRRERRDADVLEKHHLEREQREATRRAGYETDQRMQRTFKDLQKQDPNDRNAAKQATLAERAKYQFEADSEDDELENEIDGNLDALGGAAARLNGLARATGKEVEAQNRHLETINAKSTKVDDQIAMNRARLERFH